MMTYEGHDIARWLVARGVAGIVLRYRVAPNRHPAPWDDVRRAIRLVRARAAEWRLDADRVGVMGFSAGGHLASTVGVHHDAGEPAAEDPIRRLGCRPDFLVLVYPVISMGLKGHGGSRANLLGKSPSEADLEFLSTEKHVDERTPPAFLVHSKLDKAVSSEHSAMFHAALRAKGVASEYLELPEGEHGLGCGKGSQWEAWQAACLRWMEGRGLLGRARR
jgi:acetyl esterase/lipase